MSVASRRFCTLVPSHRYQSHISRQEFLKKRFPGLSNQLLINFSESTSIPKNPRTDRPVGYAFVDLSTPTEAERAITELSGKEILERKVSVQLARKPELGDKEHLGTGGEEKFGGNGRRRSVGRGRGRGRGNRGTRANRAAARVSRDPTCGTAFTDLEQEAGEEGVDAPAEVATGEPLPLTEATAPKDAAAKPAKPVREPRERRERGPPSDGVASKNKVMVANLPYDLSEEKVRCVVPSCKSG